MHPSKVQLSDHFTAEEFMCPCCHRWLADSELLDCLESLRDMVGPVIITSGFRCPAHNAEVGGEIDSFHMAGLAVDAIAKTIPPKDLAIEAAAHGFTGIGTYRRHIHLDVRCGEPARWEGSCS